ncbi:hypothetical protein [Bifidobacterium myosotis]|uniref:hypothetical protein n=1 Tax=Bifidobacterium myosotis TaxID=1630166 RepID=UPI00168AEC42|nr:hypothetical protein [Bifidobacterium myosotis]
MPINEMMFAMGWISGVRLKEGSWMIGLMRGWTKIHPQELRTKVMQPTQGM